MPAWTPSCSWLAALPGRSWPARPRRPAPPSPATSAIQQGLSRSAISSQTGMRGMCAVAGQGERYLTETRALQRRYEVGRGRPVGHVHEPELGVGSKRLVQARVHVTRLDLQVVA